MGELTFMPTYRVISKEEINKRRDRITLINLANDFDVIRIKVPSYTGGMIFEGDDFSVTTRTKRTWYTLWLGKKEEYHVLGNMDEEGKVLIKITSDPLSNEALENFKKEWKKRNYNKYENK